MENWLLLSVSVFDGIQVCICKCHPQVVHMMRILPSASKWSILSCRMYEEDSISMYITTIKREKGKGKGKGKKSSVTKLYTFLPRSQSSSSSRCVFLAVTHAILKKCTTNNL